jgi:hypothetical protein
MPEGASSSRIPTLVQRSREARQSISRFPLALRGSCVTTVTFTVTNQGKGAAKENVEVLASADIQVRQER